MIDFLKDSLLLLPFLFVTYVALEAVERHAGGALERWLGRVRCLGPLFGAIAGAVPQCGFSAAAASFYAGGVITAGTLVAVFLSTSDELIPVFLAANAPCALVVRILALKILCGILAGLLVNYALRLLGHRAPVPHVDDLCARSHCGCAHDRGILLPALIHTLEIFAFILVISGLIEWLLATLGEDFLSSCVLTRPVWGELVSGLLGLIPNCAVSVAQAQLYLKGGMSAGALMAGSLTGSGVGLLVLFRTHRRVRDNLLILACVYVFGVVLGHVSGYLF